MVIIPLKVYSFLTELDQLPSLAAFYFRVWLEQPGTIDAKFQGLLFDGGDFTCCIIELPRIFSTSLQGIEGCPRIQLKNISIST
jgi:hypothetical protein